MQGYYSVFALYSYIVYTMRFIFILITVFRVYVTGPAKRDQVGTKYTNSYNGTYLEFCVQYLLSASCKMLPMKLLTDGKSFTYIALVDH